MIPLWYFVLIPAVVGAASFFIRNDLVRRMVWRLTAITHFAMSVYAVFSGAPKTAEGWLGLDGLSLLFLPVTSLIFGAVTWYCVQYMDRAGVAPKPEFEDDSDLFFSNIPEAIFTGCILLLLASMTFAILSRHVALQWVAIEASTLTSTPLIYFHRHRRSLEAAWKYLILCSVAIALALLGVFFLDVATPDSVEFLTFGELTRNAPLLNRQWLEIAFIFMLVGYGAKMGLAPMHNWLPDTYSEAPSPVSALLSGALLNCSFIGILRMHQIGVAAGIGAFGQELLLGFGILSLGFAGIFILRSSDYKRMLAYSSVEHIGILALGVGLGGCGVFGSLLHALNHSVVKTMLFLTASNILAVYHTRKTGEVTGLSRTLPISSVLWGAGFLAITGSPPFGTFLTEFTILKAALEQGHWIVSTLYLLFLTMAFIGMLRPFIQMTFGSTDKTPHREPMSSIAPQIVLIAIALMLGLYVPVRLTDILTATAGMLGGTGL